MEITDILGCTLKGGVITGVTVLLPRTVAERKQEILEFITDVLDNSNDDFSFTKDWFQEGQLVITVKCRLSLPPNDNSVRGE